MSDPRRSEDATSSTTMPADGTVPATVSLDAETAAIVATSAVIAAGSEAQMRQSLRVAHALARPRWVEEVILQSYLFAGFPRALNAMRLWRAVSGLRAPTDDEDLASAPDWTARGEETCATVYGRFYEPLRVNIAALHPVLDGWMVSEGYGKVLGRPGLDLARRELCVVAACVAAQQDRQLHSHLHGALHASAAPEHVTAALEVAFEAVAEVIDPETPRRYRMLWRKVLGQHALATAPARADDGEN